MSCLPIMSLQGNDYFRKRRREKNIMVQKMTTLAGKMY